MKLSVNENRLSFASRMFLLVFVVLLGTGLTVNGDQPDVELHSEIVHVDADSGMGMMLVCRARGFITSDIILNMKKKGFILTKGDGVETSGVKPDRDQTFWRRDHVIVPHSEVSRYSCEVVHASSSFRVEKVWDPDSVGGRIISSKFIDTTPPHVEMFTEYCSVEKNIFLLCEASGFYPHNITVNIKRSGQILTREDGVDTSDLRPNGDGTFQIRYRVEIGKSDPSVFSCEFIHAASGSRVEKVWAHPEVEMFTEIVHADADSGMAMMLVCRAKGFITSDITLNIKKKGFVLGKGDGVETSGVKPHGDKTYWRRDHAMIPHSEVSDYSCEVVHASTRFRVEKVLDPDSDGGERIISSKFIDTTSPDVEMFTENCNVEKTIIVTCLVSGFDPNNIILNMKRNGRILTREDGVKSSGVCSNRNDTFQRRDYVENKRSDKSNYSCEVIHAASGSHVEKVWDPDSNRGGRIISSTFIDTTPPDVEMFPENSEVQTNVIVTCLVSGFYPNNIILNMKRNGRILTREDGVKSSGVCSNEDDTFQRRDSVEIKRSDKSNYSCEVIHAASNMKVEKPWDHHLPPLPLSYSGGAGGKTADVVMGVLGLVLLLVVVLVVLRRRRICGTATCNKAPLNTTSGSQSSLDRNVSSDSGGSTSSGVSENEKKSVRQRKEMSQRKSEVSRNTSNPSISEQEAETNIPSTSKILG
ncbi:uncharacterized protein LOC125019922 isoform X2 [Mugil cephalus]|uniref:uncharacterized protein LOC125019922 isoform X2 n=1 Tax=Mugil cephalus TaxID=48193 RepID=UPI001FB85ED7|nr:uncharacterized protein LOC125019922 isoform X2 [Mugil cephalus]